MTCRNLAAALARTLAILPFLVLAAPAVAGGVRILEPTGTKSYPDIQSAIHAAVDGDVLLVGAGNYAGFTINGKSLSLYAVNGATLAPQVVISNLAPHQSVVLHNFTLLGPDDTIIPWLMLINACAGPVRIESCSVLGGTNGWDLWCDSGGHGADAVVVLNSAAVVLAGCTFRGGKGWDRDATWGPSTSCVPSRGGDGVDSNASSVALVSCTVTGGKGGYGKGVSPGTGGVGVRLTASEAWFSAGSVKGGGGGGGYGDGAAGGAGLLLSSSAAHALGTSISGGSGGGGAFGGSGPAGPPVSGSGLTTVPGAPRDVTASKRVLSEGAPWSLGVSAQAGDAVHFPGAARAGFRIVPMGNGTWLLPMPTFVQFDPWFVYGTVQPAFIVPPVAGGALLRRQYRQGVIVDPAGEVWPGGPLELVALSRTSPPDCNGNGINDFVEVLEGLVPDLDNNLIPDGCTPPPPPWGGPDWYVDASAPPGGSGSPSQPFNTLAPAVYLAQAGHTIEVADGVYTGPGNRELDLGDKPLTIFSTNGPAACVLDLQQQGRAFKLSGVSSTPITEVRGFTFRNGRAANGYGGAIAAFSVSPRILDCVFEDCSALRGGAVYTLSGSLPARIRDCRFRGNVATATEGGGAVYAHGQVQLVDTEFEDNRATGSGGMGGAVRLSSPTATVTHCVFLGNEATQGGAIADATAGSPWQPGVALDNCLFAGNLASEGGAVLRAGQGNLRLVNCTLVDNQATASGSELYVTDQHSGTTASLATLRLRNSLVWSTQPSAAVAVQVAGGNAHMAVDFSNLEGGAAGVLLTSGGNLVWGSGNLDVDPQYADPDGPDDDPLTLADNDYRLGATSPCIDAADNEASAPDLIDLDGDGDYDEPVPFDLDDGPRFVDVPAIPDTGAGTPPIIDMGAYERAP